VKIRFDADKTARDVDLAGDIAKARAVRKLVGDGFPLAFDSNNGYSVQGAIRVGRALEELGYVWFEEPVQHYHVESFAKVADALDIAVSAGEQEYTLQGIKRLIEAGVDIVQPDIVKTGGFTGLGDMAALARAYGVDLVPHQTQPSIGHTANLHFVGVPHPLALSGRVQRPARSPGRGVPDAGAPGEGQVRPLRRPRARARGRRERAEEAHDPLDLVGRDGLGRTSRSRARPTVYTFQARNPRRQNIRFKDAKSGSGVTLTTSEVKEISSDEFKKNTAK
jgi:L-alanine-DL-glutamate epimerase-like enolase superfamily enzyme